MQTGGVVKRSIEDMVTRVYDDLAKKSRALAKTLLYGERFDKDGHLRWRDKT